MSMRDRVKQLMRRVFHWADIESVPLIDTHHDDCQAMHEREKQEEQERLRRLQYEIDVIRRGH